MVSKAVNKEAIIHIRRFGNCRFIPMVKRISMENEYENRATPVLIEPDDYFGLDLDKLDAVIMPAPRSSCLFVCATWPAL